MRTSFKITIPVRFTILIGLSVILFCSNIIFGGMHIPLGEIFEAICGKGGNETVRFIITECRLPSAVAAVLCGASLAASGLMLQTVFHNPLAGPSILGITSGAGLGVAVVMLLSGGQLAAAAYGAWGQTAMVVAAFAGSIAMTLLLLLLAASLRNNLYLLIAGIMAGYLATSLTTLFSSLSSTQGIQGYVAWGMGNFGGVTAGKLPVFASISIAGCIGSVAMSKPLDLIMLGTNYATNLGLNTSRSMFILLTLTGLLTGSATAFCGPIGFIGMAVPQIARMTFNTDRHILLMPASILLGGIVALLCNVLSTAPQNTVIPINALTPVFGVPVILYVLLRKR